MRIEKLFKVLVVGGSVLTVGCGADPGKPAEGRAVVAATADVPVVDVAAAADVAAAVDVAVADVVSADAVAVDAGAADAPEAGVLAWLSWI